LLLTSYQLVFAAWWWRVARVRKRYSRDFPMARRGKRRQFNCDYVPRDLWWCVTRKARREGVSLRGLILDYLARWCGYDAPADD